MPYPLTMDEDEEDVYSSGNPLGGLSILSGNPYTTPEALKYSREILDARNQPNTEQDLYLQKVQANADKARSAIRAAREKISARKYGNTEAWLAAAAGFGSPTRTGAFGETAGNVARNLIEPVQKKRQFQQDREKSLLDLDLAETNVDDDLLKSNLELMKLRLQSKARMEAEALKQVGKQLPAGGSKNQSKAQEAVDRAYSKEYVEFATQQGGSDQIKAIDDLEEATAQLKSGKTNLTGPVVGSMATLPIVGKWFQDVANPESANVQELVEYTVQQSLRPILGAQFTEKEGERLISRVFNPRLDEKVNARRLEALTKMLKRAYSTKVAAKDYWEKHGTLGPTLENPEGFQGQVRWSRRDIEDGFEAELKAMDPKKPKSKATPTFDVMPDDPVLEYEDLLPARARGGVIRQFAEGGSTSERTEYEMPDGRVIRAPKGVSYDEVFEKYNAVVGGKLTASPQVEEIVPDVERRPDLLSGPRRALEEEDGGFDLGNVAELGGSMAAGALGARATVGAGHSMSDLIPGRRISSAQSRVLNALDKQGLSPEDWTKLTAQANKYGVPAMGIDTGGLQMRTLGEAAMNPENLETREMYNTLRARQKGSRGRVEEQVNKGLKPDEYFAKEKELIQAIQNNASPDYTELETKFPTLKSPALIQLLDTPSGKEAVKRAMKAIRDVPGATIGKADVLGMVKNFDVRFLDQVKQAFDDMVIEAEGSGPNYEATGEGRRIRNLRKALRNEMDLATTDPKTKESLYKKARAQYSGDIEVLDQLRFGREDFMKKAPKELEDHLNTLNFTEKDALRTGVAQRISETLRNPTSKDFNAAQKLIGSPETEEKLKLLFDKPNEFRIFKRALEMEAEIYQESRPTLSAAQRALRRDDGAKVGVIQRTAKKAPTLGIASPVQWVIRYFRKNPEMGAKESAEILKMLRTNDTKGLQVLERSLSGKAGRERTRKLRKGKAGIAGAIVGGTLPFLGSESEEDETILDESTGDYARGGKVAEQLLNHSMFGMHPRYLR